ncbi:MAG: Gfo/Idh/MocA family oxidoreductase [Gemmatimonadetes bacterium]|nr:Gfo/Idh/MocA family oxidoreductase [Gemmatimonadota bacterium]
MSPTTAAGAPAIALIGCGAIARSFHLPALVRHPGLRERLILADPEIERARALGAEFGVTHCVADYRDALDEVQGVVIATPHHLHFPIAMDAIRHGVHVLSEKPLAERAQDIRELQDAAALKGVRVAVNNTRRLMPASRRIAEMIHRGEIGKLRSIEFFEGDKFGWPSASGSMFGVRGGGKGVLLDFGAHVLDLICWWMGGKPEVVDYRDDSFGGSEAVVHAVYELDGCRADVRLSWLAKQRNTVVIRGDGGEIEAGIYDLSTITVRTRSGQARRVKIPTEVRTFPDLADTLIANFAAVLRGAEEPLVTAADVLPSIELIEESYPRRRRFEMPWHATLPVSEHASR